MGDYHDLSPYYDQLFPVGEEQGNWLRRHLAAAGARRVLDAGCGTGRHLVLMASWGYQVAGLEPEADMAAAARAALAAGGHAGTVIDSGIEEANRHLEGPFDAALCLGNTLAHLEDEDALARGLGALAALLDPGACLITQTVNFDKVMQEGHSAFPERTIADGQGGELRFRRNYDLSSTPGRIAFQLELTGPRLSLRETILLRPLTRAGQEEALAAAGFADVRAFGNWGSDAWQTDAPATILLARRLGEAAP